MLLMGTVLETPINAKLNMYIVSPKHKPIIPLRPAKSSESVGRVAKSHSLPETTKHAKRKMVVDMIREMLAEIGLASDNATLYRTGDMVQQKAAVKAASSPIIFITQRDLGRKFGYDFFYHLCGGVCFNALAVKMGRRSLKTRPFHAVNHFN